MSVFERVMEIASRRGFFWPSCSDVYSNYPAGLWSYGPLGARLIEKITNLWRRIAVNHGAYELITPNMMSVRVFEASGHTKHFSDRFVECKKCHSRFRVEMLLAEHVDRTSLENITDAEADRLIRELNIKCPRCGSRNFTEVARFNLMFTTRVGAKGGEIAVLRPETTQGSVVELKHVIRSMRSKLPVILYQQGSAFRNEISPRLGLVRLREFHMMELHIFFDPENPGFQKEVESIRHYKLRFLKLEDRDSGKITEMEVGEALREGYTINTLITYWLAVVQKFFNEALCIPLERLRYKELSDRERAHYAAAHWDLECYTQDLGWIEVANNAYRTDYDIKGHMKLSGEDLTVDVDGKKIIPHMYEPSIGIDRTILNLLLISYTDDGERRYLRLPRHLAPVDVGVLPLVKRDGLDRVAREIAEELKLEFYVEYDDRGTIGRRYRRLDEIGTPVCVTVDYETLEDNTVTLRDRDGMNQVRVPRSQLADKVRLFLSGSPLEKLGEPLA